MATVFPKARLAHYDSAMRQAKKQPTTGDKSRLHLSARWRAAFIIFLLLALLTTIWARPIIGAALREASQPGLSLHQRLGALKRTTLTYGTDALFRLLTPLYVASGDEAIQHSLQNSSPQPAAQSATHGPLRVSQVNSRYFEDASGQMILLTGSHTWLNLQDSGKGFPPPAFDYTQYLDFLQAHHHNFFRLWVWEQSRWTVETADDDYWFNPPGPFLRTGPGLALDGKPKFDLTQFDPTYFQRLRERVSAARERGIYVSVMLFNGWSVNKEKSNLSLNNPWHGHPFNIANNINGIDGDAHHDDSGEESHELSNPELLAFQETYVKRVVDAVNDLDNVLFEISNESHPNSMDWQEHMVTLIHNYERSKPFQHPVGITKPSPEGDTQRLLDGPADWISPDGSPTEPFVSDGRKVILYDTDHLCGMCYGQTDGPDDTSFAHDFVWTSFLAGYNPIYMDGYDGAGYGVGGNGYNFSDPRWVSLRNNMGYALDYSRRVNFAAMLPRPNLSDSAWVLANTDGTNNAEYLVYQPRGGTFSVNLGETTEQLFIEWLNPETGAISDGGKVVGGTQQSFTPPFSGDAVLYLTQQARAERLFLPLVGR